MTGRITQTGFLRVKPQKRKQKNTPSRRAANARYLLEKTKELVEEMEAITSERQAAWAEGDQPNVTEHASSELKRTYGNKRGLRRDIYAEAPQLEGRPVFRGPPR